MKPYRRIVAIGDSITEGLWDGTDETGLAGWADRLAAAIDTVYPGVQYANLAIRGKRSDQILAEQVPAALDLDPDLVLLSAGVNDILTIDMEPAAVIRTLDQILSALAGRTVMMLGCPEFDRYNRFAVPLRGRIRGLNRAIGRLADRHGIIVLDMNHNPVWIDDRFWAEDRLHASAAGHERIAWCGAELLGYPAPDWRTPFRDTVQRSALKQAGADAQWLAEIFTPWLVGKRRQPRTQMSERTAKRPRLAPPAKPAGTLTNKDVTTKEGEA